MIGALYTAPEVSPRGDSLLLIDADYLAYMIGGISQSKDKDNTTKGQQYVCLDEETDRYVWVDPIELVHWRVDNELDKIKDSKRSDNSELWLTPSSGNFRVELAVTKPYKGGRSSVRPYHYQAIRDYLVSSHQAQVAEGCEADDMVCTRQMDSFNEGKTDSIIVGIDKDLLCMFGNHYNPRKDEHVWMTWWESAIKFYGQMITGDQVDAIPGCRGRGIAFWNKILSAHDGNPRARGKVQAIALDVISAYQGKGHDFEYILEQGNLLHMRREIDQAWDINFDWEKGYHVGN